MVKRIITILITFLLFAGGVYILYVTNLDMGNLDNEYNGILSEVVQEEMSVERVAVLTSYFELRTGRLTQQSIIAAMLIMASLLLYGIDRIERRLPDRD